FLNGAVPSNFGSPPGSGFNLFPIGLSPIGFDGVPRYMDGWERLGGILPVRWVFNFPRRITPRTAPSIDMRTYLAQTRDAAPPASHYGYFSIPASLNLRPPTDQNSLPYFYTIRNDLDNPNQPLIFRGIYIDNNADRQFQFVNTAPDVDGDSNPDHQVFVDNLGDYRPELAQIFDWVVKPPQFHLRRTQIDSGWLQDDNANALTERNLIELNQPANQRVSAPNLYVPPGVEVRFDVVPTNAPNVVLQRTWLIRHDGQPFRAPDSSPFTDDGNTLVNESTRLVFVDHVQLGQFDADNDNRFVEDPINFRDDDGDGLVDEDPPQTALQNLQMPQIVVLAEGNVRVSGQVAVSVKIVTPETIYVEGPLYPVTASATIELLAKRNVCINFASARTPIWSLDGLNPVSDRFSLLPQFQSMQSSPDQGNTLIGFHYNLPNWGQQNNNINFGLFADLLGGSVGAWRFPVARDINNDRLVDQGSQAQVIFGLTGVSNLLSLSDDLVQNFNQLRNRTWTLRLILLHRGFRTDENNNLVRNPW
ncbi:MAG: hypothetical protein ACK40X_12360, partial [Armatimonadota bacterium]